MPLRVFVAVYVATDDPPEGESSHQERIMASNRTALLTQAQNKCPSDMKLHRIVYPLAPGGAAHIWYTGAWDELIAAVAFLDE